jgi:hypothetical protein
MKTHYPKTAVEGLVIALCGHYVTAVWKVNDGLYSYIPANVDCKGCLRILKKKLSTAPDYRWFLPIKNDDL